MATNTKQVMKKAQTIMRQCDKDGDGTINMEEFQVIAEKFPVSEFLHARIHAQQHRRSDPLLFVLSDTSIPCLRCYDLQNILFPSYRAAQKK